MVGAYDEKDKKQRGVLRRVMAISVKTKNDLETGSDGGNMAECDVEEKKQQGRWGGKRTWPGERTGSSLLGWDTVRTIIFLCQSVKKA